MTIHLVYPRDPTRRAAPWSIGNGLTDILIAKGENIVNHDWESVSGKIAGDPHGAVLLGHPHPGPGRSFEALAELPGWRRRVAITPWGGLDLTRVMLDRMRDRVDHIVAICGPYWAERMPAEWEGRCTTVDMAVNMGHYPHVKHRYASAYKRGILYIGCTGPAKGTPYLETLIAKLPQVRFGHVGHGEVRGATGYGYVDMSNPLIARGFAGLYDFVICPGRNDANPTTALEAASWGMIPLCVPTAGWDCFPLLTGDPDRDAPAICRWQEESPSRLARTSADLRSMVAERYTWKRFVDTVAKVL